MAIKVRPLGEKVLVKRDEAKDVTDSGIVLPESAKDTPKTGTIQAVGEGKLNEKSGDRTALSVKKGDRILFSSYSGTEVKLDDVEMLLMNESEILAVLED